jgi:fructokinase
MKFSKIQNKIICGVDIGGTKIEVCFFKITNNKIKILSRKRVLTQRENGQAQILKNLESCFNLALKDLVKNLNSNTIKKFLNENLLAIGFALPGTVDPKTQIMTFGNTMALMNFNFKAWIQNTFEFKGPISCLNDANAFIYAETFFGVGQKFLKEKKSILENEINSVGIILGTGVGGGVILNGKLQIGSRGSFGEIGHTTLVSNGFFCYCGRRGCAENYLSGKAFEASFISRAGKLQNLNNEMSIASYIITAMKNGDPLARAVCLEYQNNLCHFLGNIINFYDPHFIVLGGGMSNADFIYKDIQKLIKPYSFIEKNLPSIYKNILGDSAGVFGAGIFALSCD